MKGILFYSTDPNLNEELQRLITEQLATIRTPQHKMHVVIPSKDELDGTAKPPSLDELKKNFSLVIISPEVNPESPKKADGRPFTAGSRARQAKIPTLIWPVTRANLQSCKTYAQTTRSILVFGSERMTLMSKIFDILVFH